MKSGLRKDKMMKSKRLIGGGLCLAALAGLLLAGCGDGGAEELVTTDNKICPLMDNKLGDAGVPPARVVEYGGKKIGFCCPPCVAKWAAMEDDEKNALLETALASSSTPDTPDAPDTPDTPAPAPAAVTVINTKCPIMGGKLDPAKVSAALARQFGGRKIGFCCAACPPKWDALSVTKKVDLISKMTAPTPTRTPTPVINTKCPIMGGKVNPAKVAANLVRTFGGKKVGFCCAGCPAKWDKLASAEKTELMAKLAGGN